MTRNISVRNIYAAGTTDGDVLKSNTSSAVWVESNITGPKITGIVITDSSYASLDDTAVTTAGGYLKIIGSGFVSGCQVIIGKSVATSVTFISSTEVRTQIPAKSAGTYTVYVTNPDGGAALRVPGVTYSDSPTWQTGSSQEFNAGDSISLQLSASSDTTISYALQNGSTLPSGLTLTSGGLLSGTVNVENDTSYSFTVEATDLENQNSPRTFSVYISVADQYFSYVTLLLNGDGSNNATSNTFVDVASNVSIATSGGIPAQGSFSPVSRDLGKWSVYFNGSDNQLSFGSPLNSLITTGPFSIEGWVRPENLNTRASEGHVNFVSTYTWSYGHNFGFWLWLYTDKIRLSASNGTWNTFPDILVANTTLNNHQWAHIAVTRDSSNVIRIFKDGVHVGNTTYANSLSQSGGGSVGATYFNIGIAGPADGAYYYRFKGHMSNIRVSSNTCFYSSNFTVPTTPLSNTSGTALLYLRDPYLKDYGPNNYTTSVFSGTQYVSPYSPFAPGNAYSTNTVGGSAYYSGSEHLIASSNTALGLGTGDYEISFWSYGLPTGDHFPYDFRSSDGSGDQCLYMSGGVLRLYSGADRITWTPVHVANRWNYFTISRVSNTTRMFVNGSQVGSTWADGGYAYSSASPLRIGARLSDNYRYSGALSGFKIIKGQGVTTQTIPTSAPTVTSNTSFLCNFTNTTIDSTGLNHFYSYGNTTIRTDVKKYGTGSLYFDGSGDYIASYWTNTRQSANFGTGDFTIELWVYFTSLTGNQGLIDSGTNPSSAGSGQWYLFKDTNHKINFGNHGAASIIVSTNSVSANSWTHIAVTRSGTSLRVFVNGTQDGSATNSTDFSAAGSIQVGMVATPYYMNGYIDDVRITKGYARYTANFTPPTTAFKLK